MTRALAAIAAAAILAPGLAAASAGCALDYRFEARLGAADPRFEVRLRLAGAPGGETRLRLAPEWGGIEDFHRHVAAVAVANRGARLEALPDGRWRIEHAPGERLEVRYRLANGVPGLDGESPLDWRALYRNAIGATSFRLSGHASLLLPEHLDATRPLDACLAFTGLPSQGSFATNHVEGHAGGKRAWRVSAPPERLRASLFLGGDYRVARREIAGGRLVVATRGDWKFDDVRLADAAARVVESHRRFWADTGFPHYLIALSPNRHPRGSTGGTALDNAFAMHASRDFAVPGPAFDHVLAHEHLHTWIPGRIGAPAADEALDYWFSEGFTNYLTHRLQVRAGLWSLDDYARALNAVLRELAASPLREAGNARVAKAFWTDEAAARIPYLRGELFALHLAARLADSGGDLDDTLRALRREPGAAETRTRAVERLREALRAQLPGVDADIAAFIDEGRPLDIGAGFLGPCFEKTDTAAGGANAPRFRVRDRAREDPACRRWISGTA